MRSANWHIFPVVPTYPASWVWDPWCSMSMFMLLSSSDYDNSVTSDDQLWVGCHTRPCFRVVPCGLLQYSFRWGAEDHYRQAATSVERCRARCQWHPEIRPRSVETHACNWATLARRSDASTPKLLAIWPTAANQFLTLFSASICIRPAVIKSLFHATGSARTAVGFFLLLVRQSGTHCPKTIWSVLWTVTDSHWRHILFSQY